MLQNFFKLAWRNLLKGKMYSAINLLGLSIGMAVTILIACWIDDELSFDRGFANHDRIGKVWQFVTFQKDVKSSYDVMPVPIATELRTKYPDFKYVALTSGQQSIILGTGDKKVTRSGHYAEPDLARMLSLKMLRGDKDGISDMQSILLSGSTAGALFGDQDPINKTLTINNNSIVKVAGVFQDLPANSSFRDLQFIAAWKLYASINYGAQHSTANWDNNSFNVFVQLKQGADFQQVSNKIRDIRMQKNDPPKYKPEFFLFPMDRWHLYGDFTNGVNTGGLIQFVWLFGIIGVFVLLLACINFMNLSTARSERRAREVGIRKAIGSVRGHLILQFFSESLLVAVIAFGFSLVLVVISLPLFNAIADKKMVVPFSSPLFWLAGLGFSLITGLIAGSYPALYLSSFQPVKVLKGTFKAGRLAAVPRKTLVVLQFTVSVMLIIGTITIYRQVQFARDLPVGYSRNGLIEMNMNTPELTRNYETLRNGLLATQAVDNISESSCSITSQDGGHTDISWEGKDPDARPLVMGNDVTYDFGRTVGWTLTQGRDFSRSFATDSSAIIINEAAVKLMGFQHPLGSSIRESGKLYTVIGVIRDMIREDPFQPVKPTIFIINANNVSQIQIRLAPGLGTHEALAKVGEFFHRYNPASPFDYRFVDKEYTRKFGNEQRIGRLAGSFALLAVLISCLGLFGLASFVAEQRTKEIGVRKVLGASIFAVWKLLSKEFVVLVILSLLIAIPTAWYYMHTWLQNYTYHTRLSWWIFVVAGCGALVVTLLTVSFQAIRAAVANPVKSLRSE